MYNKLLMNDSAPLLAAPLLKKRKRKETERRWGVDPAICSISISSDKRAIMCSFF
jgi:hypothetical protein